jgi:neutral ceramidase
VLFAALALGCATPPKPPPLSPVASVPGAGIQAGVAEGDITPPPGLSLFGHGPEARVAVGFRTRLRCQAFVLGSGSDVVALVPCDLASPDLELQREASRRLLARGIPIGGDRLYLMATHTHAGPAHYFTPRRYSGAFSSAQPGFDPAVLDFLAARIADVIAAAYADLRPACVGWGQAPVYGLTHNRSFAPLAANSELPPLIRRAFAAVESADRRSERSATPDAAAPPPDPELELGEPPPHSYGEAAVDPTLSVLRIDARDMQAPASGSCVSAGQRGVFAVFGMHNTAIPNSNDLYHGDVFGFATRELEACLAQARGPGTPAALARAGYEACPERLASDGPPPVVAGIANGVEGDVSPAVDFQAAREARRIGRQLAQRVLALFDAIERGGKLRADAPLAHAYRELSFPGARVDAAGSVALCPDPALGTAAGGGAEDGPTRFRIIPQFNEGRRVTDEHASCHGYKLLLIPPEGPAGGDGIQFPAVAPIALVRIGDGYVGTAPAELTTVTGLRVKAALEAELGGAALALVGLTNSYLQYVATRDEYRFQHYEGASTLYGPNSADFVTAQFSCLARWFRAPGGDAECRFGQPFAVNTLQAIAVSPTPVVHLMADAREAEGLVLDDVDVRIAPDAGAPGWQMRWRGGSAYGDLARFSVRVVDARGKVVADDSGSSIELRSGNEWSARWLPYLSGASCDPGPYRIVVGGRQQVRSKPFAIDCSEQRELR